MRCGFSRPSSKRQVPDNKSHSNSGLLSRNLLEEYWRSVGREPKLVWSRSRFAERSEIARHNTPSVLRDDMQKLIAIAVASSADPVQWCIDQSDSMEAAEEFVHAKKYLQAALEQLQCGSSALVGATANVANQSSIIKLEHDHARASSILSRFGKLSMRQGEYKAAIAIFTLCNQIDPLNSTTYALRGACHEYMGNFAEAYEEYKKYLSLNEPTMAVMAHTGKCALKAGQHEAAERHLHELLQLAKKAATSGVPRSGNVSNFDESPSFYEAYAYDCLGLVKEEQASQAAVAELGASNNMTVNELSQQAFRFYELALANTAYVEAIENAAECAIAKKDTSLALEYLRHLQHLWRDCARYYSRAADVCAMMNDTSAEIEELSKVLDQRQSVSSRRQTLLRRAVLYASKPDSLDKTIFDLSLLLSLPGDDQCTAMAYLQRAKAFERRSCERPNTSLDDVGAALCDYNSFVETALKDCQEMSVMSKDITEAMLILANGAFKKKNYSCAARFFARALVRGWEPREHLPKRRLECKKTLDNGASSSTVLSSSISITNVDLLTKMYVAIAHTVVAKKPIVEDMFRVAYEQREKLALTAGVESKKSRATERKEAEKPAVAVPAVSYQVVEEHYQRLRALEPTVFSSLQYELLEVWEPYRTEVERQREDLMFLRTGRKIKRR